MSDTYTVEVGPKGRVVIPAPIRRELGIGQGSRLVALVEGGGVLLVSHDDVKSRLRGMFARVDTSLAAELVADRRRDAEREDGEG